MKQVLEKKKINFRHQVIKAEKKDLPILTEVLFRAFQDDPFNNWLVKYDKNNPDRFRTIFSCILKAFGLKYGHLYTTSDYSGVLVCIPPGMFNPESFNNITLLPAWLKVVGFKRFLKVMQATNMITKYHPGPEYFYLVSLATLPEKQGMGIASALLKEVLDRCDNEKIPACLETSNEKNLPLYQRHGFEIKEELNPPNGCPKTWIMIRKPH